MNTTTPLQSEQFLDAINGADEFGDRRRLWATCTNGIGLASEKEYDEASNRFLHLLRQHTDAWLATGTSHDGVERPRTRKPTEAIHAIVRDYCKTHPSLPMEVETGYKLVVPFQIEELPSIDREKSQTEVRQTPIGPRRFLINGTEDLLRAAEMAAERYFVGMMCSDWSLILAKCHYKPCGQYYLLSKPRPLYKRGSMCPSCNRKSSAHRRMSEQRQMQASEQVRLARQAYRRKKNRHGTLTDCKRLILDFVKSKSGNDKLTVKWVSRNWTKIVQDL